MLLDNIILYLLYFIADGYSTYPLSSMEFARKFKDSFRFTITQVIGLTNDDEVSKDLRPYKQMVERLNRTYKASYPSTNGFDNCDGANYDLALWAAYYRSLDTISLCRGIQNITLDSETSLLFYLDKALRFLNGYLF